MPMGRGSGGQGERKYREKKQPSLGLVLKGRGRILAPPLIESISNLHPEKNFSNQGNIISITCCCAVVNFETSS